MTAVTSRFSCLGLGLVLSLVSVALASPVRNGTIALDANGRASVSFDPNTPALPVPGACSGAMVHVGTVALPPRPIALRAHALRPVALVGRDGTVYCSQPAGDGKHHTVDSPPTIGTLRLLVEPEPRRPFYHAPRIEMLLADMSQQPWPNDVVVTKLPIKIETPQTVSFSVADQTPTIKFVLEVERETRVHLTPNAGPFQMMVAGPYPRDIGNRPGTPPMPATSVDDAVLKPGFYVFSAALTGPRSTPFPGMLVIRNTRPMAPVDAIAASAIKFADAPSDLALEERELRIEYPLLLAHKHQNIRMVSAAIRQSIFAQASRSLFVYAAFDLDGETAASHDNVHGFPQKDEPLLVVARGGRVTVLTADGSAYSVKRSDLRAAPEGPPVLPKEPRSLDVGSIQYAIDNRWILLEPTHKEDETPFFVTLDAKAKPFIAEHQAVGERSERCIDRIKNKYGGRLYGTYNLVTYREGKIKSVKNGKDLAWDEIDRTCNLDAVEKQLTRLTERIVATWMNARRAKLGEMRAAWTH